MSRLDALPADQRAVLQLLLRQGKAYGDIAGLLRISEDAVRDRAHQALDSLADAPDLDESRREEIGDYLLGQQTASQRAGTRAFLDDSPAGRTWARALVTELRPLGGDDLPDVPADTAEVDEAFDALGARRAAQDDHRRSSRLGGILLLSGLGIAVVVVLIIVLTGGGDGDGGDKAAVATPTTTTATTPATSTQPVAQINLVPPGGGTKPLGVAAITANGKQNVMAFAASDLPATSGFSYAVWLYTSQTKAQRLGFTPPVTKDGKLAPVSTPLPANAASFKKIVITRETAKKPAQPGPIVLEGKLTA